MNQSSPLNGGSSYASADAGTVHQPSFPLYILLQFVYNADMPLSIRNSEVERLARALSRLTGEGLTQTILQALRERHQRVRAARQQEQLMEDLTAIARRSAALPELDRRSPDEIIGYDEHGLPK
jgi:antitoxin VapB